MRLSDLLSRADDQLLQELLGPAVMGLLILLDPRSATSSELRSLLLNLRTPSGLLRDPNSRSKIYELLRPIEAKQLATILTSYDQDDPFATLRSLPVAKNSKREEDLFTFFELDLPDEEQVSAEVALKSVQPAYGMFAHQRVAAREVIEKLLKPPFRTVLHMPTGAGKTRTAMNIVADLVRKNEPTVVIWLVQGEELCEQAAEEFEKCWSIIGNRQVNIHRFWGNRSIDLTKLEDSVVVAGLSKLYSSIHSDQRVLIELGRSAQLVIIDEAHTAIADTYKMILEALLVQNIGAGLLGLTATPGRTWNDIQADEELAQFFGRQKVGLRIPGYETPIDYLVSEGYLANANFTPLLHSGGSELSERDLVQIQENFEIPDSVLKRLAEDEKRNLKIIQSVEQLAKNHKRILVFAATVEHSDLLAAVLKARGLNARSITSKSTMFERSHGIAEYRSDSDEIMILSNFGVLTTGFDAPRTSAAVIARPTVSLVLYSQMVGRAIRGPKAGGNVNAEIVTIIDETLPGFRSISEAFLNWEDVWN